MKPLTAFDCEVYPNYTLFMFKDFATGEISMFEQFDDINLMTGETTPLIAIEHQQLKKKLLSCKLITFNGINYDMPIVMYAAIKGASPQAVYDANMRIIVHNLKWWHYEKEFGVRVQDPKIDHIDLMEVAPLKGGLKTYAGRMHSPFMQDLPIEPGTIINQEDLPLLRSYCANDLANTELLYRKLETQIKLREEMTVTYGIDLRSKSDAQIAEAVITKEIEKITKVKLEKPGETGVFFKYRIPSWMKFQTLDILDAVHNAQFQLDNGGKVMIPKELGEKDIYIKNGVYRMGIGGLHSSEKRQIMLANDSYEILDFDVASYYPKIVLNERLYPAHIGPNFLVVYEAIVNKRLEAKKAKQKTVAESLKITVNGAFGKLGSKWSVLFSPDLMVQVTITGQLALLMLIEMLWQIEGCQVISGNTDGTTVRVRKDAIPDVLDAVETWEMRTNFELEQKRYRGVWSRDVNNYFAEYTDDPMNGADAGTVKAKGVYGKGLPLQKNPVTRICSIALIRYLTMDASIEATINNYKDVRGFVSIRTVKGGAVFEGKKVGKIVRWYYKKGGTEPIRYAMSGNKVATTMGAQPYMRIDDPKVIPEDLDREWYIRNTYKMLSKLGVSNEYFSADDSESEDEDDL